MDTESSIARIAVDGGLVRSDLVAPPDPAPGAERGRLGDADQLEREVSIRRSG